MSLTTTGASLLLLVLEDAHLLFLALLFNLAGNLGTFDIRCADLCCFAAQQTDLVNDDFVTGFHVELFDEDCLSLFNFQLLSACLDNCVHFRTS